MVGCKAMGGGVRQLEWYMQMRTPLDLPPYIMVAGAQALWEPRCFRLLLLDNALELFSFFPAYLLHEALKDVFPLGWDESSSKITNLISVLTSGIFSGAVALFILHPLNAFRARCFLAAFDPSVSLLPRGDVLKLYRGLSMSLLTMALYRSAYVGIFSLIRRVIHEDTQPYTAHVLAAGLAGMISYPFDVVATHQMATGWRLTETVSVIVSKGGRLGLFAGLMVHVVLSPVKGMGAAGTIVGLEMMREAWVVQ